MSPKSSAPVLGVVLAVAAIPLAFAACGSDGDGDGSSSSGGSSGASSSSGTLGGSSGASSSGDDSGRPPGVTATCIVGSQGCLCDSRGECAPPMKCTPQQGGQPPLCCNGTDCTNTSTGIGTVCPASGTASACTPGSITIGTASGANDGCGYPTSTFNEYEIFCGMTATGGGDAPAIINVFYNDEHALPLGCENASNPVTPYPGTPTAQYYPQMGDPACTDTVMRPMRPVLYITDITADPNCKDGDQQKGGKPYYPTAVFGSWKIASESGTIGQPTGGDPASNGWNLGMGADAVPASVKAVCAGANNSWGTEIQFAAGLIPGHSYRLQVVLHDGDQTKGADSGEGCATFCASAGTACQPASGACKGDGDCCSGLTCSNGTCAPGGIK